jgi:phage tail sheath protein FI
VTGTSASKPIEGVSTSVAAFVGLAAFGPVDQPVRLSSWSEFARAFGDPLDPGAGPFMKDAYLAHAVYGFFENGGTACHVLRVGTGTALQTSTWLDALVRIDEITMLCVPDLMGPSFTDEQRKDLQGKVVAHCEARNDRMAILDPPLEAAHEDMIGWRNARAWTSKSAALYYPWLEVTDPVGSQPVMVPPCGHVAGVWASNA